MNKPTLVIGASENPERYSYKAINMLLNHNHKVYGYGNKAGNVSGCEFFTEYKHIEGLDTITLYIGEKNQTDAIKSYIESLQPKRVIFNPGTENSNWQSKLEEKGIQAEEACTLVLLQTEQY